MGCERQPRDYAESAAASALERPKQLWLARFIYDADLAVDGHDLGLEQARGRRSKRLGKVAEPAALHETRDTNGGAAATLNVSLGAGGSLVGVEPHAARARRDSRNRL